MPPILGLLKFTHSRKTAFAICCFDLTTEFQPRMLNLPSSFSPVLIVEDAAASGALVSSAYKFLYFFQMFLICTIKVLTAPNFCGQLQVIK